MNKYVTHLECSLTKEKYPKDKVLELSQAGRPLLVKYDLERINSEISKDSFKDSALPGFWRYYPLLPISDLQSIVSLGETITPLIDISDQYSNNLVLIKDEGKLPTGSFKARGLALAVAMAKELKIDHLAIPTNGNAGAALAAYASRAKIKSSVFCPNDTPAINIMETKLMGAETYLIDGLINDCGKIVIEGKESEGWFDVSTLKEPYRLEGKKTMGIELLEQLHWKLPDAIFYPTGGGTGLIGMWKAFNELYDMGWIKKPFPRMYAVQSSGCAPIVRAFQAAEKFAELWEQPTSQPWGIRVPVAVGDFLILDALYESQGSAYAVDDAEVILKRNTLAGQGIMLCPEGAATALALDYALENGDIGPNESVVLFNCANGLKYPM
ncbi:MAG: threonine synthase [Flavobacteriia bacterium]|nr:threonine synthase [Flavobacteriia bacterium]